MLEIVKDQWRNKSRLVRTRQRRWLLFSGIAIVVLILFASIHQRYGPPFPSFAPLAQHHETQVTPNHETPNQETNLDLDQPPTYERLKKWEMDLPQHNLDLPYPEGRTGRYVLFKNQIQMLGWNNQLNEV